LIRLSRIGADSVILLSINFVRDSMAQINRMQEMADLEKEIAAFETRRADLEKRAVGKWVVFHDQDLTGIFDSFELAAQEAVRRFGRGPYLIRQVGEPPVTLPASLMYHPVYANNDKMRLQQLRDRHWQGSTR
jgi:hypothetical protein